MRGKNGDIHYVEVISTPNYSGIEVIGVQGIGRDITKRKKSEEQNQKQLEHLTALSSIDLAIAANFDLSSNLAEALAHVVTELGVDAADILTLNLNTLMLECKASRGFRTYISRNSQVHIGDSFAGRAALERKLVQIPDMQKESDKNYIDKLLHDEEFVSYIGVPLMAKGQVKGVLEVFHREPLIPDLEWFDFLNALAGQAAIAIENSTDFDSLQHSNTELTLAFNATLEGWSRALDMRDQGPELHTRRVAELSVQLASIFGFFDADLDQIRWGALMHDIGKMAVPDRILPKPGPLTPEEWITMKKHPTYAYEMLSPIHYLRLALDIPHFHHEKWDGTGYPHGLRGNQIPLGAGIFSVVAVWDALGSDPAISACLAC